MDYMPIFKTIRASLKGLSKKDAISVLALIAGEYNYVLARFDAPVLVQARKKAREKAKKKSRKS